MADETTPEAEEVVQSVYDLSTSIAEADGYLVGFAAIVKVIDDDGRLMTRFVVHEMNNYEIVGILQAHLDRLRQDNVLDLYSDSEDEEEEDEE